MPLIEGLNIAIDDMLREQEEERRQVAEEARQAQFAAQLNIPGPQGVLAQDAGGGVSEAGGVPASRDPTNAEQIRNLQAGRAQLEANIRGINQQASPAKFATAMSQLGKADAMIESLGAPSAPLERRAEAEQLYATGNSHGFIALTTPGGKVKKMLFANGPGVTETPTLEDIVQMTTLPPTSKASADLNKLAGGAMERYTNDMRRLGASDDMLDYLGEDIQRRREENFLGPMGIKERPNSLALQNEAQSDAVMTELFPDFKKEDLQKPTARTVTDLEEQQVQSMGETINDTYARLKEEGGTRGKGGMKADIMAQVIADHGSELQAFGVNGAKRTVDDLMGRIDAIRSHNFQQEVAQTSMTKAAEKDSFTNAFINKVGRVFGRGDPIEQAKIMEEAAQVFIEGDDLSQLGNVVGSAIGARRLQDGLKLQAEQFKLRSGVTLANTTPETQQEIASLALVGLMTQEIGSMPPQEHHVYMDMIQDIKKSITRGTFSKDYDVLHQLSGDMARLYSQGINLRTTQQNAIDLARAKEDQKRRDEFLLKLDGNQYIKSGFRGNVQWKTAKTDADHIARLQAMAADDELWAQFESEFGEAGKVRQQLINVSTEKQRKEAIEALRQYGKSHSTILTGVPTVGKNVQQRQVPESRVVQPDAVQENDSIPTQGDKRGAKVKRLMANIESGAFKTQGELERAQKIININVQELLRLGFTKDQIAQATNFTAFDQLPGGSP